VVPVFSTAAVAAAGAAVLVDGDDAGELAEVLAVGADVEAADEAQPAASRASEAAPTAVASWRLIRVFIAFSLV
jgi:hypothetical protein